MPEQFLPLLMRRVMWIADDFNLTFATLSGTAFRLNGEVYKTKPGYYNGLVDAFDQMVFNIFPEIPGMGCYVWSNQQHVQTKQSGECLLYEWCYCSYSDVFSENNVYKTSIVYDDKDVIM